MFKISPKIQNNLNLILGTALNFFIFLQTAHGQATPPPIIPTEIKDQPLKIPHNVSAEGTTEVSNNDYLTNSLLPGIATTIIMMTGGLALVFVVISGIQYLTAYGQPDKAATAKKTLTYALLGVVLGGLSYAIVAIIAAIRPK